MVKANDFLLKDKDGKSWSLKQIRSKYTILYFYPKDDTPGCTIEAQQFSALKPEFDKLDATIIGISGGDEKTKMKFCDKYGLKILLLSDPTFTVSKAYGVYGEKKFMGRIFNGIKRTSFLLDKAKNIIKTYNEVKPGQHEKQVLEDIKKISITKISGK